MNPRQTPAAGRRSPLRSVKYWLALLGIAALICAAVVYFGRQQTLSPLQQAAQQTQSATPAPTPAPTPTPRTIADFNMVDLNHGWVRYSDGSVRVTEDGGAHWTDAAAVPPDSSPAPVDGLLWLRKTVNHPAAVNYQSHTYPVKKSQFLTDLIGWAQVADDGELGAVLLVTADGGATWSAEVTPDMQAVMDKEREKLKAFEQEMALYADRGQALRVMQSDWALLPDKAAPGDVVLVRAKEPGSVKWEGKTYKLEPFGAGYFTYLPIGMDVKPGKYPVGGAELTIQPKKFETQYLTVTEEMESMRQETDRIAADQKKIDKARSVSAPQFLFTSDFIQPIEGRLTTPYGYTRYVNGKLDSSHRAIDLAAPEGTPVKAANDGIVALADNLYLTGNSVYIDHGMHLFSQYIHMSKLLVKTGDKVKKGDVIGLVGTTGFSTGPHLHFTFWAHNVPVNPNLFFKTTPFHWQ